jgi:transposase
VVDYGASDLVWYDLCPMRPMCPFPRRWRGCARVAELESENEVLAAQLAVRDAQLEAAQARLAEQIEDLRRRLDKDFSASSRPPSSDNPYQKKQRDRSLRGRSGRKPGKQPGAQSSTLRQSPEPDHTVECGPAACGGCGRDLADAAVLAMQKRQVFEAAPPPPPAVTEYQVTGDANHDIPSPLPGLC